jgi:isoprenylcysteine carboxyl methyltransferase (ICMT) family protein YpbQ
MNDYAVLTNRKRALIAMVHSMVFLGIACHGFASPRPAAAFVGSGARSSLVLILIYFTVASILAWLVSISRCARERFYFTLCSASASSGLLRTVFGDAALPAAQYLRIIMLTSAVIVGAWIFRSFSHPEGALD